MDFTGLAPSREERDSAALGAGTSGAALCRQWSGRYSAPCNPVRAAPGAGGRGGASNNNTPLPPARRPTARLLARRVEELCERTGQDRVDLVGHSLGGL
ncbi:esterase/lipase family protein, partial [Streptomyces goshikiensis]|uniref:esterase/lipase family protein n=1 Tax=Streptomyces goshikiensis TaxID=1942 RepID=UPI003695239B